MTTRLRASLLLAAAVCALSTVATAAPKATPIVQTPLAEPPPPQPSAMPPMTQPPQDVAYAPGALKLVVDATDLDRRIVRVRETIPVAGPGPVTLLYPQWLPGDHEPDGPIDMLSGLVITANGQRVEWVRDTVDAYAFHVVAPAGAKALDLAFDYVSPVSDRVGRVTVTPEMANLQWNTVALYPAGYFARRVPVDASVKFPEGWGVATALEAASTAGGVTTFKRTDLDTLVDSPIFAGRYFKRVDLDPGGVAPVHLNIVADKAESLEIKPEQLAAHRALIQQAYRLYGSRHYGHYEFLLALSDRLGGIGLEHHQSSENGVGTDYFTDWDKSVADRDLLPHEYTHSWNGKFRRPADLWTPSFNVPMRDSLLWVYEGQTQYWGYVLAARAGLWTQQQFLDALAATAATYDKRIGRTWRAMQDTTNDPILSQRRPLSWRSWQRSEDYYSEGQLIWLDADTLIRERSAGKRSLDDFARAFLGAYNGSWSEAPYTFDDVVKALNAVEPYDWASFLRTRLDGHGPGAPLDGLARGGYKLVYTDEPSAWTKTAEGQRKITDLTYSLGLVINSTGNITDVLWEGPAFKAGLTTGRQVIAVNGTAYAGGEIKDAVKAAKTGKAPIELLVKSGDRYATYRIDYHEGLKYPHLERVGASPARLEAIVAAKR